MKYLLILTLFSTLGHALEDTAFHKKKLDIAEREQAIIVAPEGYYPQKLTIFEGEKVKFFISSTVETPTCMMMPSHKLYIAVRKGKIAEGEAYFDKPGKYIFYCPTGKIKGTVTVLERPTLVSAENRREIASTKVQVWRPKED